MSSFRSSDTSFVRKSFTASICCFFIAAAVYAATLAAYVFPGESARQLVQWTGIDTLAFPDHPVWGFFGGGEAQRAFARMRRRLRVSHLPADGVCRLAVRAS